MKVRAVRGATTVGSDTREGILAATGRLLAEMLERNAIPPEEVVSIVFTATDDLAAAFPAEAARQAGLTDVPLLCAREMSVRGSPPRCVRILLHFHTERDRSEVKHVYLEGARTLRHDLG